MRLALILMMVWHALVREPVRRVATDEKIIALTFDGGPDPVTTAPLLERLAARGVRATFFVVGKHLAASPRLGAAIVEGGHELANHSFTHPKHWWWSLTQVLHEITDTDVLIRRAGERGPIHFRTPYFERTPVVAAALFALGKRNVFADVFTRDWEGAPGGRIAGAVIRRARPGSIVLLHERGDLGLIAIVEEVVTALQRAGYHFVTIEELLTADGNRHH